MALLEIEGLGVAFGGVRALNSLDMAVHQGSLAGVIGPNGAGKTTLFNVLSRLVNPAKGDVRFKGESMLSWPPHDVIYKGISRTFQTPQVFKRLTVLETCMVGAHCRTKTGLFGAALHIGRAFNGDRHYHERAKALIDTLQMGQHANDRVESLPLVAQRKVELARALMSRPALLLLDEVTAGMTWPEKEMMVDSIGKVREAEQFTILVVEHDMRFIHTICDHIVVLNFGQRLAEGTPREIQENEAVVKAYMGEEDSGD